MIKSIIIPKSIQLSISKKLNKSVFLLKSKNGSLLISIPKTILVYWKNKNRTLFLLNNSSSLSLLTLTYKKIINIISGLSKGYSSKLKLIGRGFKYNIKKNIFFLNVGFSHTFKIQIREPFKVSKASKSEFNLISLSQQQVNEKSFMLQNLKFPDSYKGKGICLSSKVLKIKEGKKKMY